MKIINVSKATNTQLDWLVARCEGHGDRWLSRWREGGERRFIYCEVVYKYTERAEQMQPIIEREKIATHWRITDAEGGGYWQAENLFTDTYGVIGATQLIAVARCYVVSKLGNVVEVPEELV